MTTNYDILFRELDDEYEVRVFRAWARDNHKAGETISPLWHPVVRAECAVIDAEAWPAGAPRNHDPYARHDVTP